jgi:hypothetical protein
MSIEIPTSIPIIDGTNRTNPIATTGPLIRKVFRLFNAPSPHVRHSGLRVGSGGVGSTSPDYRNDPRKASQSLAALPHAVSDRESARVEPNL